MIFNVRTGIALDDKVFRIPYDEVRTSAAAADRDMLRL